MLWAFQTKPTNINAKLKQPTTEHHGICGSFEKLTLKNIAKHPLIHENNTKLEVIWLLTNNLNNDNTLTHTHTKKKKKNDTPSAAANATSALLLLLLLWGFGVRGFKIQDFSDTGMFA